MKKTLTSVTALLLAISTITACGNNATSVNNTNSTSTQSQTVSDVSSKPADTSKTSDTSEIVYEDGLTEEVMPAVDVTSGGGDELRAFVEIYADKISTIPGVLLDTVSADERKEWKNKYLNTYEKQDEIPNNIDNTLSVVTFFIDFDISYEKGKQLLTELNTANEKYNQTELMYTDEEIEAICTKDLEKCDKLFLNDNAIKASDGNNYTPKYVYSNTMEQLDKVGIKAEDLLKNADAYAKLNLSEKAKIAFLNKIAKYAVYQAQLGKLKGDIKLPALATYKAPEKVKDATFSVNENSTMVVEEFMPSVDVTSGGGDELRAFMEIYADKISTIPGLLLDTVSSDEQTKWKKKYSETFEKQTEIPNNIDNTLSVVTFFIDFDISYEKGKQLLTELNTANEKYNQTELMYTKEEIEAICTKDLEKCEKLFLNDNAIKASDGNNYTPKYVYSNTMEQLDKVGIKAEDLLKNADAYAKLNLSDEAKTAFQNKIAKYAVYQAQLGKLTGEIKLPALATYKAPEKVKDATFSV